MRRKLSPEDPQSTAGAARRVALDLLARREHSTLELRGKLVRRGFSVTLVDSVVGRLVEEDLLSEARFAEAFCRTRVERGFGPARIERDLHSRGVPADVIGDTLAIFENRWMQRLAEVHRKRFREGAPRDALERARQLRFLRYRGFTLDQIGRLFREQ